MLAQPKFALDAEAIAQDRVCQISDHTPVMVVTHVITKDMLGVARMIAHDKFAKTDLERIDVTIALTRVEQKPSG